MSQRFFGDTKPSVPFRCRFLERVPVYYSDLAFSFDIAKRNRSA